MGFYGFQLQQIAGNYQVKSTDVQLPNSSGGLKIGDDIILGDRDIANTGVLVGGQNQLTAGLIFGMNSSTTGPKLHNNGGTAGLYIGSDQICVKNSTQGYFPTYYITSSQGNPDANQMVDDGMYLLITSPSNCPTTNHGVILVCRSIGTPFQIFFPDNQPFIYKRWGLSDGQFKGTWYKSNDMTAVTA